MSEFSPIELYKEAFGLTDDDLEPGEREKIEGVEEFFNNERGTFALKPEETALIVVDMQNHFVHPDSAVRCYEATRQLPRIRELCDASRDLGMAVIFTQTHFASDVNEPYVSLFGENRAGNGLADGSWGAELCAELGRRDGERIISSKHTYDSFEGTDLDYTLRSSGIKTVIICGTNTDRCCESTARHAFAMQYKVMFGSDVNSTDSGLQQIATLRSVRYGYGRVASADEIVAELRANAGDSVEMERVTRHSAVH